MNRYLGESSQIGAATVNVLPSTHNASFKELSMTMNGLERKTLKLLKLIFGSEVEIEAQSTLYGRPDFFISSLNLCIFSDGGFFHDDQGAKMTRYGLRLVAEAGEKKASSKKERSSNPDRESKKNLRGSFWLEKARVNRSRDRQVNKVLRAKGYRVVRLKERRLNGRDPLAYVSRAIAEALRVEVS